MAHFFIQRRIFAWAISIVITLGGFISILSLPIEQYPDIAPPAISIRATYTGASADTVQNSVTQVLEQQMTGLDNLLYMSSSSSTGSAQLTLTFASGTNPDTAQVQVQNKVSQANAMLPQEVQQEGVTVSKSNQGSMFMVIAFRSEDGSMDATDISDYMASTIQDPISRIDGVGNANVFGAEYAMRIWLDPEKLSHYKLMTSDVISAIETQNADVSSGELGGTPAAVGQQLNATVTSRSRLRTPDQFGEIILKSVTDGAIVYLRDVATIELGSEDYSSVSKFNGKPASGIGLELASGANALDVAKAVNNKLEQLKPNFPDNLIYQLAYDTTPFVSLSIQEVIKTLGEAIALVVVIMFLFLQNWRATLIPIIAVPVVLMGTFGILSMLGYSINTLTLFAMVLAIGLLVDDAIVVVENVERVMSEEGLSPVEATRKSMGQITSALVGIAMVLTAVFIPMAFFSGSTGEIYRQFAVTIASAMGLSVIVALTLSPALCASILRPVEKGEPVSKAGILGRFFFWFNRFFDRNTSRYQKGVGRVIRHRKIGVLTYLFMVVVMGVLFLRLPTSFLPQEDQGMLMVMFNTPPGATQQRTLQSMDKATEYILQQPEVESIFSVAGFSTAGDSQNSGMGFVRLKDWSEREASAQSIAQRITMEMASKVRDAQIFVALPAAISSLGSNSGFTMHLQDLNGNGHEKTVEARKQLLSLANSNANFSNVRFNGLDDAPTFQLDLNDKKARALNLNLGDINNTLSTVLGGTYVNDFVHNSRVKRTYVQGDVAARMLPQDIDRWQVRNANGDMISFSEFSKGRWTYAPQAINRFNGVESMEITGDAAIGVSSGTAMNDLSGFVDQLSGGFSHAWSGMSYQEQESGSQAWLLYAVTVLFVFLCLAALYESWTIPAAVILAIPVGLLGAVVATSLRGLNNDIYFQVGLLATMGLAAKNGILIVEFARELEMQGKSLLQATLQAAKMRLRPIIMTSLAFLLGVFPMVVGSGAGSGARHSLGTGVLGGTLISTLLGIFFVPLFYIIIRSRFPEKKRQSDTTGLPELKS